MVLPAGYIHLFVLSPENNKMKILIIGSEGFIGKHCSTYFVSLGNIVHEADVIVQKKENYSIIERANSSFDNIFINNQYDICINASGSANVGFSFDKPDIDFELNVINVHKLLVSIRTFNPGCRLINFSSAAVYGNPTRLPIEEEQPKNPVSPYGFHKLQSEYLLKEYHRFFGIGTCNLRIFSAYGPGLKKQLFWDLFQKTKHSGVVTLFGTGNETRDFIYIDDLLLALSAIIEKAPFDGSSYNVAAGVETKISRAADVFFGHLGSDIKPVFSGETKQGDPDNWVADIQKIRELGFHPQTSLEQGLKYTTDWLKNIT